MYALRITVKPRQPRLEYGGTGLSGALTLREGQEVTISCVSRYGNPPAVIKWYGWWFVNSKSVRTLLIKILEIKISFFSSYVHRISGGHCMPLHVFSPLFSLFTETLIINSLPDSMSFEIHHSVRTTEMH